MAGRGEVVVELEVLRTDGEGTKVGVERRSNGGKFNGGGRLNRGSEYGRRQGEKDNKMIFVS